MFPSCRQSSGGARRERCRAWDRMVDLRDSRTHLTRLARKYPSIVETIPPEFPSLKHEFSKLENQILTRPARSEPLTPVLPAAHDRIFTGGYHYNPVHTSIYGTNRARTARVS